MSSGVGAGIYITGFSEANSAGIYGEITQNFYDSSDGRQVVGGDVGFLGRSLGLGVRLSETIDFILGGQAQGSSISLSFEYSLHLGLAGLKIIIPINGADGRWSGYGVGITIGPGLYAGANINVSGTVPVLESSPDGGIRFSSAGSIGVTIASANAGALNEGSFDFRNGSGTITGTTQSIGDSIAVATGVGSQALLLEKATGNLAYNTLSDELSGLAALDLGVFAGTGLEGFIPSALWPADIQWDWSTVTLDQVSYVAPIKTAAPSMRLQTTTPARVRCAWRRWEGCDGPKKGTREEMQ